MARNGQLTDSESDHWTWNNKTLIASVIQSRLNVPLVREQLADLLNVRCPASALPVQAGHRQNGRGVAELLSEVRSMTTL